MNTRLKMGHIYYPLTPQLFDLLILYWSFPQHLIDWLCKSTIEDAINNSFVQQFAGNIKFNYTCFDRVIIRGYIRNLFFEAGVVHFLRAMGFPRSQTRSCVFSRSTQCSHQEAGRQGTGADFCLQRTENKVRQYYIYFHDQVLGGPCYLKISSYLPVHCEFYF